MEDIIKVLREVGEVSYWRMGPAAGVPGAVLSCPPIIAWKYKKPTHEFADFFRRAVGSYRGPISWEISIPEERLWSKWLWCLMPSRISECAKSHGGVGGLAAARILKETEPDFGIRANADVPFLAAHIRRQLQTAGAIGDSSNVLSLPIIHTS